MGLKNEITPEFIANSICQDSYSDYNILVEGETDETFFSKFFNADISQIYICHGKGKLLEAVEIINDREKKKEKTIGIIDKDYDFLDSSLKHPENIIHTDFHDIEMMCLYSNSFDNISREYFSESKVLSLLRNKETDLRSYFLSLVEPISRLRILSKNENLYLAFKPSDNKYPELNYNKIICKNKFIFKGYNHLVNTVKRYGNQAQHLNNESIIEKITCIDLSDYNIYDICHGHDLTRAIAIGMKKIGRNTISSVCASEIERVMRLSFSLADFSKTQLYKRILSINGNLLSNPPLLPEFN